MLSDVKINSIIEEEELNSEDITYLGEVEEGIDWMEKFGHVVEDVLKDATEEHIVAKKEERETLVILKTLLVVTKGFYFDVLNREITLGFKNEKVTFKILKLRTFLKILLKTID